jgi:adenosylcobinamide-GDP ribazoletransferase
MHEDGLADTADGFWGGFTTERRLEIMKDSHIGTYGVIALVLSLLVRWAMFTTLVSNGAILAPMVAAATLSRTPMVGMMALMPNARRGGLSASVGRPGVPVAGLALAFALLIALPLAGAASLPVLLATALPAIGLVLVANRKIGGQTGDVLGAGQQLVEIAVLAVLATRLA